MKQSKFNFHLLIEALVASALMVFLSFVLNILPFKIELINPIRQELENYNVYDLYYADKKEFQSAVDSNIIIVQVAYDRPAIARQLQEILSLQPAIIGVDVLFDSKKDNQSSNDSLIRIMRDQRICLAYRFVETKNKKLEIQPSLFNSEYLAKFGGFINFDGDSFSVVRSFKPIVSNESVFLNSFALTVFRKFAREDNRKNYFPNKSIWISYMGKPVNFNSFTASEFDYYYHRDFLQRHDNIFANKIILLGYFSKDENSLEDKHFTPFNESTTERGLPDMYGVFVHANIINMLLSGHEIKQLPRVFSYIVAYILSFFLLYFSIWLHQKHRHFNHIIVFVVQIIYMILLVLLFLQIYDWFLIRLYLSPIIVSLVLCVEFLGLYKWLAWRLSRITAYRTIFNEL
ncbi:MAG: CHASE2 domain-containing protein [Bacteroidetes bacterium]|nr:CHASE2 domain-containing protein [Bacteroidota bacterium]